MPARPDPACRPTGRARGAGMRLALAAWAWLGLAASAEAAALEISPVIVEAPAGANATTVTVRNDDSVDTPLQLRVVRWSQAGGVETLEPTDEVVASPPIGVAPAKGALTLRILRNARTPVRGEAAYRLVLDQLPKAPIGSGSQVSILLRQVLPVFFPAPDRSPPRVTFSFERRGGRASLVARNDGDRRLRINRVDIKGAGGAVKLGGALLGYALGHSEMSWSLPAKAGSFGAGTSLHVETDTGPLDVTAHAAARN